MTVVGDVLTECYICALPTRLLLHPKETILQIIIIIMFKNKHSVSWYAYFSVCTMELSYLSLSNRKYVTNIKQHSSAG